MPSSWRSACPPAGSVGIGFNSGKHVRAIIRTEKFLAKIAEMANRYMTR